MVKIEGIKKNSDAHKKGIKKGDRLVAVNGHRVKDVLDYRFYSGEDEDRVLLSRHGTEYKVVLKKDAEGENGLVFSTYLMDEKRSCRNKCIFCFIDQNPPGMREGIYFKDDDERLSFLQGNYVTLTNLTEKDIERIIKMKISPVNISVHTLDKTLRAKLMGNRFAGEKLEYLYRLAGGGAALNLQFVLCRGINDKAALASSLEGLEKLLAGALVSASAVPAGLTKHRKNLYPLTPYDRDSASEVIDIVEKAHDKFLKNTGKGRVFCGDEFYLLAERPLPSPEYYEEYPQYENGVGMTSDFIASFEKALARTETALPGGLHVATGQGAHAFMKVLVQKFCEKFPQKKIALHKIINNFYGGTVTSAGLITGNDYIEQLKGRVEGTLFISRASLNAEGTRFLDDITPGEVEKSLGVNLMTVEAEGGAFCAALAKN